MGHARQALLESQLRICNSTCFRVCSRNWFTRACLNMFMEVSSSRIIWGLYATSPIPMLCCVFGTVAWWSLPVHIFNRIPKPTAHWFRRVCRLCQFCGQFWERKLSTLNYRLGFGLFQSLLRLLGASLLAFILVFYESFACLNESRALFLKNALCWLLRILEVPLSLFPVCVSWG